MPLGPSSIRKLIDALATILDDAIEDELLDRNPAAASACGSACRGRARTFLEMDELVALIDAAEAQDRPPDVAVPLTGDRTRDRVARMTAAGARPSEIAAELGLAKSTVAFHLRNLGAGNPRPYGGRRAIIETLGPAGIRASELCDLCLGDVRLRRDGPLPSSATPRPRPASARSR